MNTHSSHLPFFRLPFGLCLHQFSIFFFSDELSRKMDVSLIDFIQNVSDVDGKISISSLMLAFDGNDKVLSISIQEDFRRNQDPCNLNFQG
jgi:hypothetical protein